MTIPKIHFPLLHRMPANERTLIARRLRYIAGE